MKIQLYRLASEPIVVEVEGDGSTVKAIFSAPGSGGLVNREGSLMDYANAVGGVYVLGSLRVNGIPAELSTAVSDGDLVMLVPQVEGGGVL